MSHNTTREHIPAMQNETRQSTPAAACATIKQAPRWCGDEITGGGGGLPSAAFVPAGLAWILRLHGAGMIGCEEGLVFKHGAGDGDQAVGDGAQGAGMAVAIEGRHIWLC